MYLIPPADNQAMDPEKATINKITPIISNNFLANPTNLLDLTHHNPCTLYISFLQ